jgi:hypothetical protein
MMAKIDAPALGHAMCRRHWRALLIGLILIVGFSTVALFTVDSSTSPMPSTQPHGSIHYIKLPRAHMRF